MRIAAHGILLSLCYLVQVTDAGAQAPASSGRICTLPAGAVTEASGVVASRKHSGVFWTHGDSGTGSGIIAFDKSGAVLARVEIKDAPNLDWEDIATDTHGQLYIGDIGDGGHYAIRNVFIVDEPDPRKPPADAIAVNRTLSFRHPEGKRFDMEALFFHGNSLYIIAKTKLPGSKLFRIRDDGSQEAELDLVTTLPVYLATGADASPDGKRLVVCSYNGLWVFPIDGSDAFVDINSMAVVGYRTSARVEGCTFDGPDVVLMDELGSRVFRVTDADIKRRSQLELK